MLISLWSHRAPEHRRRPELARELLRRAVARHVGLDVPIVHESGRAPHVEGLSVSLSRTADVAMCVVGSHAPIGVDVERLRPWNELAEIAPLVSETPSRNPRDLLSLWTRKEALAKAMGVGLPDDVRTLDVLTRSLEPGHWQRHGGWLWIGCPCEDGCVASLVVGRWGPNERGPCNVVEAKLDEPDVRAWSIEVPT